MVDTGYSRDQAETYDEERFKTPSGKLFDKLEKKQLHNSIENIDSDASVLEIGCGTGRFTNAILRTGRTVVATDISPHMLEKCRNKTENGAKYARTDAANLPFNDGRFEFVFSIRVMNQLPSKAHALRTIKEMIRVCSPGGTVLVEFVNEKGITRDSGDTVFLTPNEVETAVRETGAANVVDLSGILSLSQTALEHTPEQLLSGFEVIDTALCKIAPAYATRCYAHIKLAG